MVLKVTLVLSFGPNLEFRLWIWTWTKPNKNEQFRPATEPSQYLMFYPRHCVMYWRRSPPGHCLHPHDEGGEGVHGQSQTHGDASSGC